MELRQRIFIFTLTCCACYSKTETVEIHPPKPVAAGQLVTADAAIWAEDSSFRIDAGTSFSTPFFADECVPVATAQNYKEAHALGARPVVVQVPQLPQPIYGLLAFCRVPAEATGPATRSYELQIPDDYIQLTEGGRVSVVTELTNFEEAPAWQLWLSRSPSLWQ